MLKEISKTAMTIKKSVWILQYQYTEEKNWSLIYPLLTVSSIISLKDPCMLRIIKAPQSRHQGVDKCSQRCLHETATIQSQASQ